MEVAAVEAVEALAAVEAVANTKAVDVAVAVVAGAQLAGEEFWKDAGGRITWLARGAPELV